MTRVSNVDASAWSRRFAVMPSMRLGCGGPFAYMVPAALALLTATACNADRGTAITQEELVRKTQEILDGVTAGDPKPFERYFADDALDHDEKGRSMDKKALVADITPPAPTLVRIAQAQPPRESHYW